MYGLTLGWYVSGRGCYLLFCDQFENRQIVFSQRGRFSAPLTADRGPGREFRSILIIRHDLITAGAGLDPGLEIDVEIHRSRLVLRIHEHEQYAVRQHIGVDVGAAARFLEKTVTDQRPFGEAGEELGSQTGALLEYAADFGVVLDRRSAVRVIGGVRDHVDIAVVHEVEFYVLSVPVDVLIQSRARKRRGERAIIAVGRPEIVMVGAALPVPRIVEEAGGFFGAADDLPGERRARIPFLRPGQEFLEDAFQLSLIHISETTR